MPSAASAAFQAPLLEGLLTDFEPGERRVVLDFGAPSTAMLTLLGHCRCLAEIVDIAHFGGIESLNAAEPGPDLDDFAGSLLPQRLSDEGLDTVFCWDLPNYLSLDALAALMRAIAQRATHDAVVHMLIYYSDTDMPDVPARLVPTEDGRLMNYNTPGGTIPAPRYSPEELGDHMAGFAIDRARLLANGMQEFLFRLG